MFTTTDLLVTLNEGVRTIKFNRPSKKNAIGLEMYIRITNILNNDASDDNIIVTIFTGIGEYYSSGNDLTIPYSTEEESCDVFVVVKDFVTAFINYPKLIIAVVNGPAIGIAVTTLALCDVVYASERATFQTPFLRLGVCPEGCSSYLFPKIMGRSKASEMLLLGEKITAQEAYQTNFVSKVIPHEKLPEFLDSLQKHNKLSVRLVKLFKKMIVDGLGKNLHELNNLEIATLMHCLSGEDTNKFLRILKSKSKL